MGTKFGNHRGFLKWTFGSSVITNLIQFRVKKYLEKYFAGETIQDYNCDNCMKKTTVKKRQYIWKFPEILFIFFKRFQWGNVPRKIKGKVAIPFDEVDLSLFCFEGQHVGTKDKYKMIGQIDHQGEIAQGHYTT